MKKGRYLQQKNKARSLFWLSVFFLSLHSLTFLAMPFASRLAFERAELWGFTVNGISFWLFLLIGHLCWLLANRARKQVRPSKEQKEGRIGIISFFRTLPGMIADILFAVAAVVLVVMILIGKFNTNFTFVLFALLALSANMHGLFNGRNYKFVITHNKKRGEKKK